jgi:hypothetical protein
MEVSINSQLTNGIERGTFQPCLSDGAFKDAVQAGLD